MHAMRQSPRHKPVFSSSHSNKYLMPKYKFLGMLYEALKRPFGRQALLGLVLTAVPIVSLLATGYKVLCAATAMRGNYELPEWKNWKQLFVFGLSARAIQGIWLAPAAILYAFIYLKLSSPALDLPAIIFIGKLLAVFLVLLAAAAFFAPASVLNYVAEGKFKSAFSWVALRRAISKEYLIGWLLAGVYFALTFALFVGALLAAAGLGQSSFITIMVFLIYAVLFWFPGITLWTLLGEAWGRAIQAKQ